jgi:hypothetical protein
MSKVWVVTTVPCSLERRSYSQQHSSTLWLPVTKR